LPEPQTLVLRGGAIFDSEARTFRAPADLVCRGGRIAEISATTAGEPGTIEIDCTGKFLLPGLIDCHVHLTVAGDPGELNNLRNDSAAVRAWHAGKSAERTLQAGVTTVRDLGAVERLNIDLAQAVESGLIEGPRILAAGLGVTMTGGHGHGFIAREADGPDDVRKAVREQLRAGAGAIKLFASGGVMTPGVNPRSPSLTEEELRAGVEEAHKAFRVVAAHAQATDGIKNAIRAGVDSIEHGVWLDDEAIEMMCERGTYLVPTLTAPYMIAHGGLEAGIPKYMVDKSYQVLEDHYASYQRALAAGVLLAMGTDQGTPLNRPGENAQEIVRMAQGGLSPAAAILAATRWAAALLALQDECGELKTGLAADVLVLDANPLADLSVLTKNDDIRAVVKGGRLVRSHPGEGKEIP
jgi:imidazolonepropionase-like amidohydrolase